jgi:hypothetical protein
MTGNIQKSIAPVRIGDIKNKKISVAIMKTNDLTNIDTFVLRPSYITDMSEFSLLTLLKINLVNDYFIT